MVFELKDQKFNQLGSKYTIDWFKKNKFQLLIGLFCAGLFSACDTTRPATDLKINDYCFGEPEITPSSGDLGYNSYTFSEEYIRKVNCYSVSELPDINPVKKLAEAPKVSPLYEIKVLLKENIEQYGLVNQLSDGSLDLSNAVVLKIDEIKSDASTNDLAFYNSLLYNYLLRLSNEYNVIGGKPLIVFYFHESSLACIFLYDMGGVVGYDLVSSDSMMEQTFPISPNKFGYADNTDFNGSEFWQ